MEVNEIDWLRWQRLVNTVAEMFNAPATFINQANIKGIEVIIASERPGTRYAPGGHCGVDTNIYCHHVVKDAKELYVRDASTDGKWLDNPEYTEDNYASYLGMPICWPDGSVFGTLCVLDTHPTDYPETYVNALGVIKEVIDSDLKHLYRENQLLTLSYTDPLTLIYNRRGFDDLMSNTRELAKRLNRQLVLLYFDLDHFKATNDRYGHQVGDEHLKTFANTLKHNSRTCDLVARWGGDEFVVLIHAESLASVSLFNQRLANALTELNTQPAIEYSIGYAIIAPSDTRDNQTLLDIADQQMYTQKQAKQTTNPHR
ncbi:GGDEF domain-containing protein [Shewanella colwelliana]|uniref:diguanylate cyclase n=2 Tax=Shewanella colwelliana TaxID=23 RepID=A0ABQ4NUZ8_SHECO|nr:GGDEF domain-containing protein [Shewanella colwelliana]